MHGATMKMRFLILTCTYAYVTKLLSYLKVYQIKCCEHFEVCESFIELGIQNHLLAW
jgi:hypothetical protein